MSMTRKHYEAFAEAFKYSKPVPVGKVDVNDRLRQWEIDVKEIAEVLCGDNSRFSYDRFYTACGLEEN